MSSSRRVHAPETTRDDAELQEVPEGVDWRTLDNIQCIKAGITLLFSKFVYPLLTLPLLTRLKPTLAGSFGQALSPGNCCQVSWRATTML